MQPAQKRPFPTVELYERVSTEHLNKEIAGVFGARDRYQGKVDQLTEVGMAIGAIRARRQPPLVSEDNKTGKWIMNPVVCFGRYIIYYFIFWIVSRSVS